MRRFNGHTMKWEENPGVWAGFWADRENKPRIGYPERGYAVEFKDDIKKITGLFVNTNKTGSPYNIPWQHEAVHRRLWELRLWQETYNPIPGPINAEQYVDNPAEMPKTTKRKLPDIFPLFRLLPTSAKNFLGRIPTTSEMNHAWQALMAEIQRVWNLENPANPIDIVEFHPKTGQARRSIYNPHGMRVRGLTDLYRGGMPVEILSKVVAGHATVRMTVFYLDLDPVDIDERLTAAAVETRSAEAQELMDSFTRLDLAEARRRAVSLDPAAIEAAHNLPSNITLTNVDIGFCPYNCTRCFDGGPLKRSSKTKKGTDKHIYDRVPGGHRNCILCRHFVSGPPWAVQLELYGTKLCEQRQHLAKEETRIQGEQEKLEQAWRDGTIGQNRYRQLYDERDSAIIKIKEEQIIVENAIFNVELLLLACIGLMSGGSGETKLPMVAGSGESIIQYVETSQFEHSLLQTAASRIHHVLDDPRVEEVRDRYLDLMLFDAGIRSPRLMVQLTEEQRAAAMDMYADLLRKRTSQAERAALVEGDVGLQGLPIWDEIKALMAAALKGSIELPDEERVIDANPATLMLEVLK